MTVRYWRRCWSRSSPAAASASAPSRVPGCRRRPARADPRPRHPAVRHRPFAVDPTPEPRDGAGRPGRGEQVTLAAVDVVGTLVQLDRAGVVRREVGGAREPLERRARPALESGVVDRRPGHARMMTRTAPGRAEPGMDRGPIRRPARRGTDARRHRSQSGADHHARRVATCATPRTATATGSPPALRTHPTAPPA